MNTCDRLLRIEPDGTAVNCDKPATCFFPSTPVLWYCDEHAPAGSKPAGTVDTPIGEVTTLSATIHGITVKTTSDYEGYFTGLIWRMVEEKKLPNHHTIVVSAGPWRSYDCQYTSKDRVLYVDFYSAVRNGFGTGVDSWYEQLKELL